MAEDIVFESNLNITKDKYRTIGEVNKEVTFQAEADTIAYCKVYIKDKRKELNAIKSKLPLGIYEDRQEALKNPNPDLVIERVNSLRSGVVRISTILTDCYVLNNEINYLYKIIKKTLEYKLDFNSKDIFTKAVDDQMKDTLEEAEPEVKKKGKKSGTKNFPDAKLRESIARLNCKDLINDLHEWDCVKDDFRSLMDALDMARDDYRRAADDGMAFASLLKTKGLLEGWGRGSGN